MLYLTRLGIRLGEHNIGSAQDCITNVGNTTVCADPVQDIFLEEVIPHPNYNSTTYSNDIGLLRLILPAQLKGEIIIVKQEKRFQNNFLISFVCLQKLCNQFVFL